MRTTAAVALLALAFAASASAAEGEKSCGDITCDPVQIDLNDTPSLQRGARIFVNYCLSCHSASYMRYNRLGSDLDIPEELLKRDLILTGAKVGDLMNVAMRGEDAKAWFNTEPPDLTLVTRQRAPSWVYTYLRSFYRDDDAPSGWNNMAFRNVAMPHVLYGLQGVQRAVFRTETEKERIHQDGKIVEKVVENRVFDHFEMDEPGSETPEQYNRDMRDLTNFLVYLGEPAKLVRYQVGFFVLLFLAVFFVFAYLLKKEYWKDVH